MGVAAQADKSSTSVEAVVARTTYLDMNATAPLRPEARAAMLAALDDGGNPSSVHAHGRRARRHVEEARAAIATLAGADPTDVVLTSGGTEANGLALAQAGDAPVLVSAVEHPSVLKARPATEIIPVDAAGRVDLTWLSERLAREPRPALVSVMAANNETGVVEPLAEVAGICREAGVPLHSDAVQAAGRMSLAPFEAGIDLVTLSSHKIGGPTGAGALVRRAGVELRPLIAGGGQERGLRAGTENVAAIAGFGAAARAASGETDWFSSEIAWLRDWLETEIHTISPSATVFGAEADRLPNTTCFAVPGVAAETALIALDLEGVAVSSGSACSSGKVGPSHVLAAMGVEPGLAAGALRLSLGWSTTREDVEGFVSVWRRIGPKVARRGGQPQAA